MKSTYRILMGLGLAALAPLASAQDTPPAPAPAAPAAPAAAAPAPSPEEIKQAVSYYLGFSTGLQFAELGAQPGDIDDAAFMKALRDAFTGKPEVDLNAIRPALLAFQSTLEERAKAQAEANLAAGRKFLEENAQKEGVITTNSGLQYKIIKESRGMRYNEKVHGANAMCSITYEGRLLDGTVFDASKTPVPMPINGTIAGFAEALRLMPVGSTYELYIPAELAYGPQSVGSIPPNSTLIFTLTLENIEARRGNPAPVQLTPEMIQQLQQQGMQPAAR